MTRVVTLLGYAVIGGLAVGLELAARRSRRFSTFSEALAVALRWWPLRLSILATWLWIGWHLFVRVDWH